MMTERLFLSLSGYALACLLALAPAEVLAQPAPTPAEAPPTGTRATGAPADAPAPGTGAGSPTAGEPEGGPAVPAPAQPAPAVAGATAAPAAVPIPVAAIPAPPAPAEEQAAITGWMRMDVDALGTQFWFGATHPVGPIGIASDIYVTTGSSEAEFDIGPAFSLGKLLLTPMVGLTMDFKAGELKTLVAPQLFTILDTERIYVESWIQGFVKSIFSEGAEDTLYTRNFVLVRLGEVVAVGPHVELTYRLNEVIAEDGQKLERELVSMPVGGAINLRYGKNNNLLLFAGYDDELPADSDKITGRFTFLRTW